MSDNSKPINVRIRSRNPDDAKAILASIAQTLASKRSRELNIEIGADGGEAPTTPKSEIPTPNEPLETEVAKKVNERLGAKREAMRERGEDPDARRPAPAKERLEKRERVRGFGKWFWDKTGGAGITVVVRWIAEVAKNLPM